jgi:Temperature dependent protein affecting M2 dsRNA replication
LEASAPKVPKIKAAVDMILATGKSGYSTCVQYQDDPACRHLNYIDKFMRAKLSVKHHVVMVKEGKVEPFNSEQGPGDIHEFISNRLPDEFYYYLSRGVIGPRVLNWLVSGQITISPPLDLGESNEYHQLVRDQLNPIRGSILKMLATANHRFYQYRSYTVKCWFDRDSAALPTINVREIEDVKPIVEKWNVHENIYGPEKNKYLVRMHFAILTC